MKDVNLKKVAIVVAIIVAIIISCACLFGAKLYEEPHNENYLAMVNSDEGTESETEPVKEQMEEMCSESLCQHVWVNGQCSKCFVMCEHAHHNAKSRECFVCGKVIPHELTNGQCNKCGYQVRMISNSLPEKYYEPCPEQGKVLTMNYKASKPKDTNEIVHIAKIYLPYGYDEYDEETKYNLVFVIHGGDGDESTMMDQVHWVSGKRINFRQLYDWMIYDGRCDKFIAVTVNTNQTVTKDFSQETGKREYGAEIRNILLPILAEQYNTYAESGEVESLRAARQHIGMVGGSNGSLYTMQAGLITNMDVMGNFGFVSGITDKTGAIEKLGNPESEKYPIYSFYGAAGLTDHLLGNTRSGYNEIVGGCEQLVKNANAFYTDVNAGHDWTLFTVGMYNFMLVMGQNIET